MTIHKIKSVQKIKVEVRGDVYELSVPSALKLNSYYKKMKGEESEPIMESLNMIKECGLPKKICDDLQPYELEQIAQVIQGNWNAAVPSSS